MFPQTALSPPTSAHETSSLHVFTSFVALWHGVFQQGAETPFKMDPHIYGLMQAAVTPSIRHGPLTRYVILQVAHAPGMPGTYSPAADFKRNR